MRIFPTVPAPAPSTVDAVLAAAHGPNIINDSLTIATRLSPIAHTLGNDTLAYFNQLAHIAAIDLTVARTIEPHLDALTILTQANPVDLSRITVDHNSTWGVFAANTPGHGLHARPSPHGPTISGTKTWCSLANHLTHALVTATNPDNTTSLYAIALTDDITIDSHAWAARGLTHITTSTITCTDIPAIPIGPPNWYLERPGFTWGGIAVAAIWYGAARAIAQQLYHHNPHREPDQIALAAIGHTDIELENARHALEIAATLIDTGHATGKHGTILALRTRSIVAEAAEHTITHVGHATGPAPLTLNKTHARRVADLTVYLRQHHAQRDHATLGKHLLNTTNTP
ncbi:Uncharacterized proteins, LmbE homologs [Dermatophilus congolensis]|uniref:Uncharacterized proteins, LmbE homologs n=1 Tax=Dermatophilus congolensis TaxID=1863 RepID=A0AA46GZJ3_9MICO|nr:acyl-CoA dehydrogenase family protein [Dermatophilus congolensis]STD04205.1 Uncharacterized proteins, LmbE homologs [Dermatophilus congolensis]